MTQQLSGITHAAPAPSRASCVGPKLYTLMFFCTVLSSLIAVAHRQFSCIVVLSPKPWKPGPVAGGASFLSFCQNPIYFDNRACNQPQTNRVTKLGASQLAISSNYQLTYASAPKLRADHAALKNCPVASYCDGVLPYFLVSYCSAVLSYWGVLLSY